MSKIYSIGGGGMERIDVPANHAKNNLENGTILRLVGYSDPEYVIIEKLRTDLNNRGATYRAINLQTFVFSQHDTLGMDHIKDRADHLGIHLFYTDEILPPDQVCDIYAYAGKVSKYIEEQKEQYAASRAKEKLALPGRFPFLATQEMSKKSSHALGAKNLKQELQRTFPGTAFSVRSSSFAGGDSIDISWTDGPLTEKVNAITDKYQEGSFDGMEDLYTYNNDLFPQIFGGAKYVMAQRHESTQAVSSVAEKLGFSVEFDKWGCINNQKKEDREMIMREVWKTDFCISPAPAPVTDPIKEEVPAGSGVIVGEYKGHPVITLPFGRKGFSFGISKAKVILEHLEEIRLFTETA